MANSARFPFCAIDALDPYPWHGLAYIDKATGAQELNPMDGRPVIPLPTPPDISITINVPYVAQMVGNLFDCGLPDPPPSLIIQEAGGSSIARRIVSAFDRTPTRFGSKTMHVKIEVVGVSSGYQFNASAYINGSIVTFPIETKSLESLGELTFYSLEGIAATDMVPFWETMDASPDGRRRLVAMIMPSRNAVSSWERWPTFIAGIFEIELDLDAEGNIIGTVQQLKTAPECVSTHNYAGSASQRTHNLTGTTSPSPEWVLRDITIFESFAHDGTVNVTTSALDMIIGAFYENGVVTYVRADNEYSLSRVLTATGTASTRIKSGTTDTYELDVATEHRESTTNESRTITVRLGDESITCHASFYESITGDRYVPQRFSNQVVTRSSNRTSIVDGVAESSTSTGPADGAVGDDNMPVVGRLLFGEPGPVQMRPPPPWVLINEFDMFAVFIRQKKVFGFYVCDDTPRDEFFREHDAYYSAVLTPAGPVGGWRPGTIDGGVLNGTFRVPDLAAYNPITRQTALAQTYPDKILLGWL